MVQQTLRWALMDICAAPRVHTAMNIREKSNLFGQSRSTTVGENIHARIRLLFVGQAVCRDVRVKKKSNEQKLQHGRCEMAGAHYMTVACITGMLGSG